MSQTVSVEVGEDHLASYGRTPKIAIAELIWNALDADATEVSVEYGLNLLGGPDVVVISDNGTGMTQLEAQYAFRNFGNSWKRNAQTTTGGRSLHGKHGRGRYTAFSIGESPSWRTIAEDAGKRAEVVIAGSGSHLQNFEISDPLSTQDPTGTIVTIVNLTTAGETDLMRDGLSSELTTRFAPYLKQYPLVKITFRGHQLDPASLRERSQSWQFQVPNSEVAAELEVIEWNVKVERRLYLCDSNGSALIDMAPGIQAPGYQFTAYLRWDGFDNIGNDILVSEMDQGDAGALIALAKDRLKDYFRDRANDRQKEVIKDWIDNDVYPYRDLPQNVTEVAERQAFDLVALSAASIVNDGSPRSRRFVLSLIKTALESGPTALQEVLLNVLELPPATVDELKRLLDRTTLSSVIEASSKIADRLNFLQALDALVFDAETRKYTLERTQLHRILANETWVFGEEWGLTGDDERLTEVLKKYLAKLGKDVGLADKGPVLREDGRDAIPDLVLSRTLETAEDRWEHLVVELKRPSHRINSEDVEQIRSYAVAVAGDERFSHPNVQWTYILVGNYTTAGVDDQREQTNLPFGCVQSSKRYKIWVHTWSEIIRNAMHRYKFVQDSLNYTTSHDQGVEHLRERHNEYLPNVIRDPNGSQPKGAGAEEPSTHETDSVSDLACPEVELE